MNFSIARHTHDAVLDAFVEDLCRTCRAHGHTPVPEGNGAAFVFNTIDPTHPHFVRRRSQSVFVFSILHLHDPGKDLRSVCYTALVQSLANQLICLLTDRLGAPRVFFTTPEAGFYETPVDPERVYLSILPIASSHFATRNEFIEDLPEHLSEGSPVVEQIKQGGRALEQLGVLPVPFPMNEVLSADGRRQLYKIYGITGASYGNLSAREGVPASGRTSFWMTGRGVNKARLSRVGTDVLLVKDFDLGRGTAVLSVPPGNDPRARVSVDAVEHWMIYKAFPAVGAIVHAHAWMDGILCTRQNYPCGTRELAGEVVDLLTQVPEPARAVVGLKNHGITITGSDLPEIFARIRGRLKTQVEMFA
jgi:ribulose-5-phosphate 4-epimerase/fuculose-1-phosphate aldolase